MITSKQILHLFEKYSDTFKIYNSPVEIFVNPTISELKSLKCGRVRFIADPKSQEVYVWDAMQSAHYMVAGKIQKEEDGGNFWGVATIESNSMVMIGSDSVEMSTKGSSPSFNSIKLERIFSYKWKWLDKYVKGASAYLEDWRNSYKKKIKKT